MKSLCQFTKRSVVLGLLALSLQQAAFAQADPPARVGRLDFSEGQTSYANPRETEWQPANPNQPLVSGDTLFIHPGARAEMHLGSHALRLSGNSSVQILQLDDQAARLQLSQGSVILRVRQLYENERLELVTANLRLQIVQPGEYKLSYYDNLSTTVAVRQGSAIAYAEGNSLALNGGQQVNFFDTDLKHSRIGGLGYLDDFERWAMARDQAEDNSPSARYVPRDMPGYQQLDQYGAWENHSEYGTVWYPQRVVDDWAPYRDGKWLWIAPWGWTWIDAAPWGFAPFHYGRWVHTTTLAGRRWCWVPGAYPVQVRPVFAPALVAFIGGHSNVVIKGSYTPNYVSWFPLAPGELYRPGYHHSQGYWQSLNHTGWHQHGIPERRPLNVRYLNQQVPHAVTSIEQQHFVRGDSVFNMARVIQSVPLKPNQTVSHSLSLQPDLKNRCGGNSGSNFNAEISRDRGSTGMYRAPMNLQSPQEIRPTLPPSERERSAIVTPAWPGGRSDAGTRLAPTTVTRNPASGVPEHRPDSRYENRTTPPGWHEPARNPEYRPEATPLNVPPNRNPNLTPAQTGGGSVNPPVYTAPRSLALPNERNDNRNLGQPVLPPSVSTPAPASHAPGWIRPALPESVKEPARAEPRYENRPTPHYENRRDAATTYRPDVRSESPRVELPRAEPRPESRLEARPMNVPESRTPELRREVTPARHEQHETKPNRNEKEAERRR